MVLSKVIVDVTIPRRSFVFGQARAWVSAGFITVRSLAVAAFDLVYCSLSAPCLVKTFLLLEIMPKMLKKINHKELWHNGMIIKVLKRKTGKVTSQMNS